MSNQSLQKASKKMVEFQTIHLQKRERTCLAERCECTTIVSKKRVRKGANARLYIIKSGSGDVWLQEGVNARP